MTRRKTLNDRRLTRHQVQALIASGAKLRPELTKAFQEAMETGYRELVYALDAKRCLLVFDAKEPGVGGKGDIYSGEAFLRLLRWAEAVREDYDQGRGSSVDHWAHYSRLRHRLIANIDDAVRQLRLAMGRDAHDLDLSYRSLDFVSLYIEGLGIAKARSTLYDQLVAYVGEVLRLRVDGRWELEKTCKQRFPYVSGSKHQVVMPINVVWQQLDGAEPVNFRAGAANEVRQASRRLAMT